MGEREREGEGEREDLVSVSVSVSVRVRVKVRVKDRRSIVPSATSAPIAPWFPPLAPPLEAGVG